jgi:hypothetical protein
MYSTKAQKPIENMITLYMNAFDRVTPKPADTPVAVKGSGVIYSMLNRISNPQEMCASMASLYLLRGSPFYMSHCFESLCLDAAITQLNGLTEEVVVTLERQEDGFTQRVSNLVDYLHRPLLLEYICYYEYVSRFKKSKDIPKKNAILFLSTHSQHHSHCIKKHSEPNIVVNILGSRLPDRSPRNQTKANRDRYAHAMQILFRPFRTPEEVDPSQYNDWIQPTAAKRFAMNNQDYYDCKNQQNVYRDPELEEHKRLQALAVEEDGYISDSEEEPHSALEDSDQEFLRDMNTIDPTEQFYTDILQDDTCESVLNHCISTSLAPEQDDGGIPERVDMKRLREDLAGRVEVQRTLDPVYPGGISRDQMKQVIILARQDMSWCEQPRQFYIIPPESYATFKEISRFYSLNEQQHKMFIHSACAWAESVASAHEITRFQEEQNQFFGYLNGPAGYGKSEVVKALLFLAKNWNLPDTIQTTSFNGIAAVNIFGVTLCSMFGWTFWTVQQDRSKTKSAEARKKYAPLILLIVDEISTLKQHYGGMLDLSLRDVKDKAEVPAGGVHLLFIGDNLQLYPIGGKPMFEVPVRADIEEMISGTQAQETTKPKRKKQKIDALPITDPISHTFDLAAKGKELYDRITSVVTLTVNMRHKSTILAQLLDRWRVGDHRQADVDLINATCYNPPAPIGESGAPQTPPAGAQGGSFCPIIAAKNDIVHQYGGACILKYAQSTEQKIFRIFAQSTGKKRIRPADLAYLRGLPPQNTGKVALVLDIVMGMPMTCTLNSKNKKIKQANGTIGQVCRIQWSPGTIFYEQGPYTIASKLPEVIYLKLYNEREILVTGMPPGVLPIPVPESSKSVSIKLRNRTFSSSWKQFPLFQAFSMTVDRCQGMTLDALIACPLRPPTRKNTPPPALYVMFSRCRTLEGIRLIEPLTLNNIAWGKPGNKFLQEDARLVGLSI